MDEPKKEVDFTRLFDLADKLRACREEKKDHESRIKELNAEIDTLDKALSADMVDAECTKFSRNGKLFYLTTSLHVSAQAGKKAAMCDAFRKAGYGSLVKEDVNFRTLSSFCKEQMAANDNTLPDWLSAVVNAHEEVNVGMRKE